MPWRRTLGPRPVPARPRPLTRCPLRGGAGVRNRAAGRRRWGPGLPLNLCPGGATPGRAHAAVDGSLRAALQLPPADSGPEGRARPGRAEGVCPSVGAVVSSLGGHRSAVFTPPPPAPTLKPRSIGRGPARNIQEFNTIRARALTCARREPSMTSGSAVSAEGVTYSAQAQMGDSKGAEGCSSPSQCACASVGGAFSALV